MAMQVAKLASISLSFSYRKNSEILLTLDRPRGRSEIGFNAAVIENYVHSRHLPCLTPALAFELTQMSKKTRMLK